MKSNPSYTALNIMDTILEKKFRTLQEISDPYKTNMTSNLPRNAVLRHNML